MKERLKRALSQRQKSHLVDTGRKPSAVLIPIYCKEGQYHILFTKRTETVKNHKGQISFPGGACEKRDRTPLNTALRESAEEIGLRPEKIELLGELDDIVTIGTGFLITPFVGAIPWPHTFKVDTNEVEELIEVPISALLDKNCVREETVVINDQTGKTYFYNYKDKVIWGATARILKQFLSIWIEVGRSREE